MARHHSGLTLAAALVLATACGRTADRGDRESAHQAESDHQAERDARSAALADRLESETPPAALAGEGAAEDLWPQVRRLYEETGGRPLWLEGGRARPSLAALQRAVAAALGDGLNPGDYPLGDLRLVETWRSWNPLRRDTVDPGAVADQDLRLTATAIKLASHLVRGRVPPGAVDDNWFGRPREDDVVQVLRTGLDAERLDKAFAILSPQHAQYAGLRRALDRHREIAGGGGWATIPGREVLAAGDQGEAVTALVARLAASGDLTPRDPAAAPPVFDEAVGEAVRRFQSRHGLSPTGKVGQETREALNVPVAARIRQIEINLERWRWLPETLGSEYVLVNVPTFHLTAVQDGAVALEMAVVAGKRNRNPTPIFSDAMTTVVFSPYWNIPRNILRNETIPAVMNNPDYVVRQNLEVLVGERVVHPWSVDWRDPEVRVRQRPGGGNALGGVKFMFPNHYNVYLHDTPADALFSRTDRDFSHGCVRLEKPFELARWVLRDKPEWTEKRIRAAMRSGTERHVALGRKIPVYIVYATVWADDDGTLQFRDDIYGHDARQDDVVPASPAPTVVAAAVPRLPDES